MDNFYLVILTFLALLACTDLFVGVSNDAVNFLTSALGCGIASLRTTMFVASVGVLLGATFSSGMMEIARSGVFQPQMFSFSELMVVFLAVMASDVLLLDAFNSLGLPTSTTVSIIFELLGSATAAAVYTLMQTDGSLTYLPTFINSTKSLAIISGILISVIVAFVAGTIVQYLARLIFSFHFEKMTRIVGGVYGGFAITAIFYFLVMKGARSSSFMQPEWIEWIEANTMEILLVMFVALSVIFQVLILACRFNIFKIIILSGTFALAFAFAGNDLVNFVGVPLAALDSVMIFRDGGATNPDGFMMGALLEPSRTSTFFLLLSGMIMVVTLWLSKKARAVVQTSINLSSSNQGEHEQFGSSLPGRMIVRSTMTLGNIVNQIIPGAMHRRLNSRFVPLEKKRGEKQLAFDYVRASINLVVSAVLIASATNLKLPLSTTYVTFMVAMGSSFADGAWDRETAVYRISGVLTVISGWFLTAFTAFIFSGLICTLIMSGGDLVACAVMLLVIALLVRSNFLAAKKAREESLRPKSADREAVRQALNASSGKLFARTVDIFTDMISALLDDNESALKVQKARANDLFEKATSERSVYYEMAKGEDTSRREDLDARFCYYQAFSNVREAARQLQTVTKTAKNHVANRHRVFKGPLKDNLVSLSAFLQGLAQGGTGKKSLSSLVSSGGDLLDMSGRMQEELMQSIRTENLSLRGCDLYLGILNFSRELINRFTTVALLQRELNEMCDNPNYHHDPAMHGIAGSGEPDGGAAPA